MSEASGGVRSFVSREIKEHKDSGWSDGQDASLQRDISSEVSLGSFWELHMCDGRCWCVCAVPTYSQTLMCEHAFVSSCAWFSYSQNKMDPSGHVV